MDFDLNEEQRSIRDLCRDFAQHAIAPHAEQWYEASEFPVDAFRQMAELGLMGLLIPERYGGTNVGTVAFVAAMEEIAAVDQSIAATWNAHLTIGSLPFLYYGTEPQKQRWLVPLAHGKTLGAFGLTEPEAGSDAANIQTMAVADGDEWVINGSKCFITNAGTPLSYGLVLLAVTGREADGKKRYGTFVVPRETPGYTVGRPYRKIGWHTVDTREQVFHDCRVPRENLLGSERGGLRQFLEMLDVGRISVAALAVGLGRAALELALRHAGQRVTFGQVLSKHQAIQFKLADIATAVDAARLLTYRAACRRDAGVPYSQEAAMAKLFASEAAVRAAEEAVQIHGGYGYMCEYAVSRFYLDSKILTIGEGTSEVQRMVIARHLGC
ncbi:MAG: acyl-CoA dehydrogenase family protein [Candidatus Binatia bacterium]